MPRPLAAVPVAPAAADPVPEVPEMLALLRQIAADLHVLAAGRVADHPAGGANDDAAPGDLLRAITAYCRDAAFSTRALVAHALTMPALSSAVISVVGMLNARALGKVLKRIEGRDIGGFQVQRLGLDAAGVIWKVAVLK